MRKRFSTSSAPAPRSGMTLVYLLITWTVIVGFVSLAVDLGRAQSAKTKLFVAADAAARYGVTGLGDGTAVNKAVAAAQSNTVDGTPLVLQNSDVEVGIWTAATRTFAVTNISPNAVRVTARRTAARGNAISTTFAALIGNSSVDVKAVVIASTTTAASTTNNVTGFSNPWLAGMPAGTTANWFDAAPLCSPTLFQGVTITPGAPVNISFSGAISNGPSYQPYGPDGNTGWILDNNWATANGGSENGIGNIQAPICSMIGVFLDNSQPNSTAAPAALDFSTPESRDFITLSPLLKQPFFIGDGLRADGTTAQKFMVPAGATRLFVGIMDGFQWTNNSGALTTVVVRPPVISTVK